MTETNKPRANSRAVVQIGWAHAPWLDEDRKLDLLKSTPPYLREAVMHGTPSLGSGAVYPVPLESVVMKPNEVSVPPAYYKRVYGMDIGWNRTACVFLAHNPDDDVVYVIGEYYGSKVEPEIHAARIKKVAGDWQTGLIDPAAKQSNQIDGRKMMDIYRHLGLRLREADNAREAGITEVWSRLSSGRLLFYPNTPNLQNEYMLYRRKDDGSGKIIDENDHLMDALRYGIMGLQHAKPLQLNTPITAPTRRYNV